MNNEKLSENVEKSVEQEVHDMIEEKIEIKIEPLAVIKEIKQEIIVEKEIKEIAPVINTKIDIVKDNTS